MPFWALAVLIYYFTAYPAMTIAANAVELFLEQDKTAAVKVVEDSSVNVHLELAKLDTQSP